MENIDNIRCMFMGLPNSGKSSFIGAFWHVIESGEIEDAYTVNVQPNDREYLNELRESFLGCKAPERTKTDFVKQIDLNIKDIITGNSATFTFPDLSGETFESQFEYRKITKEYLNDIADCESIMLFINPQFLKKPNLIADANAMLEGSTTDDILVGIAKMPDSASVEANADPDTTQIDPIKKTQTQIKVENDEMIDSTKATKETVEWTPKMCQSQVILVDLLQMVANTLIKPCKISLVVSAWDLVIDIPEIVEPRKTPKEWVRTNLPLLNQYLTANPETYIYKVFGISAQGAAYSKEKNGNKKLLSFAKQSERIKVQDGESVTNDITIAFKWLING